MKKHSILSCARLAVLLLCLIAAITGCGRKGAPVPDYSLDAFSFASLSAEASADGSIDFYAKLSGAVQNMEYFVLEMQPVDGELCAGCPFLAQEQYRSDARDAWDGSDSSALRFHYRPLFPGSAYRWRLIGYNIYSGISAVVSPMQTVLAGGGPAGPLSLPEMGE